MCEAITRETQPAVISLPMPKPGRPVSLAMTVRFFLAAATSASISRCGEPTPMKPPIITTAPSGMSAAAAAGEIAHFIAALPPTEQDRCAARGDLPTLINGSANMSGLPVYRRALSGAGFVEQIAGCVRCGAKVTACRPIGGD